MNSKWNLFFAIFELIIGLLGALSFVVVLISSADYLKWIPAFLLSIALIIMGVIAIKNYKK